MTERHTDRSADAVTEADTDAGSTRHLPAFPAWRTFGAGWLADRLFRRHEGTPASTDAPSTDDPSD